MDAGESGSQLLEESRERLDVHVGDNVLSPEDTDAIFSKLSMPSLMLTKLKVKKSKQAVQDAFTVLNHNMVMIDHSMKDLLYLIKDLAQVLFICFD